MVPVYARLADITGYYWNIPEHLDGDRCSSPNLILPYLLLQGSRSSESSVNADYCTVHTMEGTTLVSIMTIPNG
eukprot:8637311-Pyramimonas_sp.AAC.2